MNAVEVLEYGHRTVLQAIDGLDRQEWERPGAHGQWSVKDMLAHLTAYEYLLIDTLYALRGGKTTLTLDRWLKDPAAFDQREVELRHDNSIEEIRDEYENAHIEAISQIIRIPEQKLRQTGTLPWYGDKNTVEDFIANTIYSQEQESVAQLATFHDHLVAKPA